MSDKEHKNRKNAKTPRKPRGSRDKTSNPVMTSEALPGGFDPELLYVECGRCGAPVIWEPGRISRLLENAGIDPLELDTACMLVTDGCPACGPTDEYSIRIFRLTDKNGASAVLPYGHA